MRYLYVFLLSICLHGAFAQTPILNKRISISLSDVPLHIAIQKVEQIAKISFAYKASAFDRDRKVSIQQNNAAIEDILKLLLFDDGAKFSAIGNQIIIYQDRTAEQFLGTNSDKDPVRDTVWTEVTHTVFVNDTNWVTIRDTVRVWDTILVKRIVKERITYSKKIKQHFVTADYIAGASILDYDPGLSPAFDMETSWQSQNCVTVSAGISTDSWELSAGLGIASIVRHFNYYTTDYSQWLQKDSVLHTEIMIDSSFIAIPGVDTVWLTSPPELYQYFSHSEQMHYDTLVEHFKQKHASVYIQLPVAATWKTELNRTTQFLASATILTSVLLNTTNETISFSGNKSAAFSSVSFEKLLLSGRVSGGFGFLLGNDFKLTTKAGAQFQLSPRFLDRTESVRSSILPFVQLGIQKYF